MAIQQKLVADFPTVPEYRADLARSYLNLGNLLRDLGKRAEAGDEYRKGMAIQQKLAADFPTVPKHRADLAASRTNLGSLLKGLGKPAEAEDEYRKGMAIQQKLAADFPTVPEYRASLAASHNNLGALLDDLGKGAEAGDEYRKGLAIRLKLATDFPTVPEYRVSLGGSYCNFGNLVCGGGKPADSLEWYTKAIGTLAPVHEKDPRALTAKQFLRNSHWGRAKVHDHLRKFAEAVEDWNRVIALSPPAEQPGFRTRRATSRLNAGMVAEAVAEVAELTKLSGWDGGQWYDFACVFSVASDKLADKKDANADRAMELLQEAVKAGYTNAAHMKTDTDLDPLRDRADFKALIANLDKKFPPLPVAPPPREVKP